MSNREVSIQTRTIHPRALKALGEETCIVMLGIAVDLRSSVIPPEKYNQAHYHSCGSGCCIAGHTAIRLGLVGFDDTGGAANSWIWNMRAVSKWASEAARKDSALSDLFATYFHVSTERAATAIENYIYDGCDKPMEKAMNILENQHE